MLVFSAMFALAVFVFLALGALLYFYANKMGIEKPEQTDKLFPLIALKHLGMLVQVFFVLGISAAAFSSADSATTALTTAFSIDFLKIDKFRIQKQKNIRSIVHFLFSVLIFGVIMLFYQLNNQSVVVAIFKAAGYTYGPIFGVFLFVFFSKRLVKRNFVLPVCLLAPVITWFITLLSERFFNGYKFGFELIVVNTAITYVLLAFVSKRH
jgi:Na+/proline symporter